MGLRRSPHLAAVVVDMATLAVADRPVAMAPTAASREAGDHSPPNMRATVLQCEAETREKAGGRRGGGGGGEEGIILISILGSRQKKKKINNHSKPANNVSRQAPKNKHISSSKIPS